jgi:hypothetical protein
VLNCRKKDLHDRILMSDGWLGYDSLMWIESTDMHALGFWFDIKDVYLAR